MQTCAGRVFYFSRLFFLCMHVFLRIFRGCMFRTAVSKQIEFLSPSLGPVSFVVVWKL